MKKIFALLMVLFLFVSCAPNTQSSSLFQTILPSGSIPPQQSSTAPPEQDISLIEVDSVISDITFEIFKVTDDMHDDLKYNLYIEFPIGTEIDVTGIEENSIVVPEDILFYEERENGRNMGEIYGLTHIREYTIDSGLYTYTTEPPYKYSYEYKLINAGKLEFDTCFFYNGYFIYVGGVYGNGEGLFGVGINRVESIDNDSMFVRSIAHLYINEGHTERRWAYIKHIVDSIKIVEF